MWNIGFTSWAFVPAGGKRVNSRQWVTFLFVWIHQKLDLTGTCEFLQSIFHVETVSFCRIGIFFWEPIHFYSIVVSVLLCAVEHRAPPNRNNEVGGFQGGATVVCDVPVTEGEDARELKVRQQTKGLLAGNILFVGCEGEELRIILLG